MLQAKALLLASLVMSGSAMATVQGLYQAPCEKSADGISSQNSVNFGKVNARQVLVVYLDQSCKTAGYAFDVKGPYTLSEDGALDLTSTSFQLLPLNQTLVDAYNEKELCGFKDWALNQPKELSSLNCDGSQFPASGDVSYQSIKEVEGGIVFGDLTTNADGSSVDKRPDEFSSVVYKSVNSSK